MRWASGEVFLIWVHLFVEKSDQQQSKKLLDKHESHKYYPVFEYETKNNVVMILLAQNAITGCCSLRPVRYSQIASY